MKNFAEVETRIIEVEGLEVGGTRAKAKEAADIISEAIYASVYPGIVDYTFSIKEVCRDYQEKRHSHFEFLFCLELTHLGFAYDVKGDEIVIDMIG